MNDQEIIGEIDRLGEVASIRKNMCKVMPPLVPRGRRKKHISGYSYQ